MNSDPAFASAQSLVKAYKKKQVSPLEVAQACLDRIDRFNPVLNAFRFVDPESALKAASLSEKRWYAGEPLGPLDGIPTSIKDSHDVKGWSTLDGSLTTSETDAAADSPHVARLRESGAVLLGKTHLGEFGWKCVTDSKRFGITRNPWDPTKTPAGSSGGAAVAAAAGMATINMGGDGGGSIRLPAAFCGIFGIKATYGVVPRFPQEGLIKCAHFGPLTRHVSDAALTLNVISRPDARDSTAFCIQNNDFSTGLDNGITGMRLAYCADLGNTAPDPAVLSAFESGLKRLGELSVHIEEAKPDLGPTFGGYKVLNSVYQAMKIENRPSDQVAKMDDLLVANARIGLRISAAELMNAGYAIREWHKKITAFFANFDALLTPASRVQPFNVGRNNPVHISDGLSDAEAPYCHFNSYLYQVNYTHHPAVSVPFGLDQDGMPFGLQIIGPKMSEKRLLRLSAAIERLFPFDENQIDFARLERF